MKTGSIDLADQTRKKEGKKRNFRPKKMGSKDGLYGKENPVVWGQEKTEKTIKSWPSIKKKKITWKEKEKWSADLIRRGIEALGPGSPSGPERSTFNLSRGEPSGTKGSLDVSGCPGRLDDGLIICDQT